MSTLLSRVVGELIRGGPQRRAASLAFTTALTIVPLAAVAFAFLKATNLFDAQQTLLAVLSRAIPGIGPEVTERIRGFISSINLGAIGGGAFIVLLVLSFLLFDQIEEAFNDLWGLSARRTYVSKFLIFYCLITLGPLLLAGSIAQSMRYFDGRPWLTLLVTMLPTWLAFIFANKLLPRARVEWRAAVAGGLFSAILFEIARFGFQLYLKYIALSTYTSVYGALGLVPIFFVWLYLSWLMVIAGAEVTYAVQHSYLFRGPKGLMQDRNEPDPLVAVRLLTLAAERYHAGHEPVTREELSRQLLLPLRVVDRVLEALIKTKLMLPVNGSGGYVPSRPLSSITVEEIYRRLGDWEPIVAPQPGAAVDELAYRVAEARREVTRGLTLEHLAVQKRAVVPPAEEMVTEGSEATAAELLARTARSWRTPN